MLYFKNKLKNSSKAIKIKPFKILKLLSKSLVLMNLEKPYHRNIQMLGIVFVLRLLNNGYRSWL